MKQSLVCVCGWRGGGGVCSIVGRSCHKYQFCLRKYLTRVCRDKRTSVLSSQTHICHKKCFVVTKICLSQQKFCHDKHTFIMTNDVGFLLLLRQNFCCDKYLTRVCHDKHTFVATKEMFCHHKHVFVTINVLS